MKFTGERVVEGETPERIYLDHISRYQFASDFTIGLSVLDVACGTGYGTHLLQEKGAKSAIGVDCSPEAIRFAKEHYKATNLEFRIGDALKLQVPEAGFDCVVSFETIEHVSDPDRFLEEAWAALKPSGRLIISSPNRIVTSPDYPKYQRAPDNPFHITEFSAEEMAAHLAPKFAILGVFGQHMVTRAIVPRRIRSCIAAVSPQSLIDRLYFDSGNNTVRPIPPGHTPRYLIYSCRKK